MILAAALPVVAASAQEPDAAAPQAVDPQEVRDDASRGPDGGVGGSSGAGEASGGGEPGVAGAGEAGETAHTRPSMDGTVAELRRLLEEQQAMIERQKGQIREQQRQINKQQDDLVNQTAVLQSLQTQIDQLGQELHQPSEPDPEEVELRASLTTLEKKLAEIPEDPVAAMGEATFPGSLRVPGTNAAFRIGGFARATFVQNFDPLESTDRFIVGSIPVGEPAPGVEEETSLTANQSRMNFELREQTGLGDFRAFVEADFARSGNTFRLRHAYGQYRSILTGQTWSTFFDPLATPEGVDFEGINGRVSLRQTQIRWFPQLGGNWNLQFGIEDPNSQVSEISLTGSPDPGDPLFNPDFGRQIISEGISDWPDIVASIRRTWFDRWHLKTAFVLHQVRAQYSQDPSLPVRDEIGWGFTTSGTLKAPLFGPRDTFQFQLIGGDGIGRYVNDTSSVNGQDGVFTPDGSKIKTLPILAGFGSYQHWWSNTWRSTFVFSMVEVDNRSFQPDDAYKRTVRASANLFWSPTPRVRLGAEYIWGQRTNNDGEEGDASQFQIGTTYTF